MAVMIFHIVNWPESLLQSLGVGGEHNNKSLVTHINEFDSKAW